MNIDAVIPLKSIRCTTPLVLQQLQTNFKPRRMYVLTKITNCRHLYKHIRYNNLFCEDENNVLPNLSITRIKKILNSIKSDYSDRQYGFGGHSIAGWYLQQFLKLGIGFSKLNITSRYLIWDSDGIMLQNFYGFELAHRRIPIFTFTPCASQYVRTYAALTHTREKNLSYGFVIHNMIIDSQIVSNFLRNICKTNHKHDCWIKKILETSCENQTSWFCSMGFSEYETYGRWSTSYHHNSVEIAGHFPKIIRITSNTECCPKLAMLKKKYNSFPYVVYEGGKCFFK